MARPTPTRGEQAYLALRTDILAGRLAPGDRLPFATLCTRYEASMGVLREALSRLAEQGLVRLEPQQGYHVMPLSITDLVDLTAARVEIETLVLREAVAHGDLAWESELLARHHTLSRSFQSAPEAPGRLSPTWTAAHAAFHSAILAGCPNGRLRAIAEGLRASAEVYRQWSVPLAHGPSRDIGAEHRALLDALVDRDADAAAGVLAAHIHATTAVLLDAIARGREHPRNDHGSGSDSDASRAGRSA
ncbi:MAG: hypothetical protein ABS81_04370 [Pseudonocardia sp. SCN 72-86]|nr:MAG: hypothetical protein ABS81_04370 [Pseudonocardia sp. SCN 72-86]